MATRPEQPLLVICGPTASGKSALAMKIALEYNGEIICADSRTVYKGMNIGTAKPSAADQKRIPHHLLDVVHPNQPFSAFNFQRLARKAIQNIRARDKLPIMVGGTGLYIDSVVFDYQFPNISKKNKERFEAMTLDELHKYCSKNNIVLPENNKNKRHVISAILRNNFNLQRRERPINNTIIVGITTKKENLMKKFIQRNEHFFEDGVVGEARKLGEMYGWDSEAMSGNIYQTAKQVLDGLVTLEEAKTRTSTLDWQLAKRQLTWLKRNTFIHWGDVSELHIYLTQQLSSRKNPAKLVS